MVLKSTAVICVESVSVFTGIKGCGDAKTFILMTNSNACSLVLRSGHGRLWERGCSTLQLADLPNSTFAKARTQDAEKSVHGEHSTRADAFLYFRNVHGYSRNC